MTVIESSDSIFSSGAEVLVDPVDCTGAQGKGLALEFKRRWPKAALWYKELCAQDRMRPGNCAEYLVGTHRIIFAATKDDWRYPSRIEWIVDCMTGVETMMRASALRSVSIPALGCGLGGLAWSDVRPIMMASAERMAAAGVTVTIYPPKERT